MAQSLLEGLLDQLSPSSWLKRLGFALFDWQIHLFDSPAHRIVVNGARQAGKSTLVSGIPAHVAKAEPGSLSVILAATERQAVEDMEKVKAFIGLDTTFPKIKRDSDSLLELANGSRVVVIPATEKGARGFSSPRIIILDEDSRIDDPVYQSGVRAMLTNNPQAQLLAISTPNGRRGHFARAFRSERWERYEIYAPWRIREGKLEHHLRPDNADGIIRYPSPRHESIEEMEEHLYEMGELMFRQEYLVEFVEPDDQVFGYDEIESIFRPGPTALIGRDIIRQPSIKPLMGG